MAAPLKRRRSALLDAIKEITRHNSKHDHKIEKVDVGPPRGILVNKAEDVASSKPKRDSVPRAAVFKPSQLDPTNTNCWSYWGPTNSLSASNLENLMRRHCSEMTGASWDPRFRFQYKTHGTFNTIYVLESTVGSNIKICVRVPAWGWVDRWNEVDAEMLRATALGMRLVREKTGVPVPEVLAYDMTMDNELGAPYIIMTFLDGLGIDQVWDGNGNEELLQIEERRQKILRSLASTMSMLDKTRFSHSGTLWFTNYHDDSQVEVGATWRLDGSDSFVLQRKYTSHNPRRSVADYLHAGRANRIEEDRKSSKGLSHYRKGVFTLWSSMIRAFLQSAKIGHSQPEFVLMHPEFIQKNVLVDEQGTVTGIIGWDHFESVPRQMAWCSTPNWLQHDWDKSYHWPPDTGVESVLHPDEFPLYREDYSRYVREACGSQGDCRFTAKSHIYRALFKSAESFEAVEHFVYNVLADILPRAAPGWKKQLCEIGESGFRPGEDRWFEKKLSEYFAPDADVSGEQGDEMPDAWI